MNPIATRELLQHTEFVRRVALALCADEHGADDLVQETWITALTREHPEGSRLRGWLAGVTRNLARQGRRGASRRDVRERSAAVPEGLPSTGAVVERMETHKQVVSAILELPAASREVIVLSYFDGLPPREIASRLDVPVETVRTRIKRARERLRERLADEHGSSHALYLALSELARHGAPDAAVAAGTATAVPTGGKVALVGMLTAVAGLGIWPLLASPSPEVAEVARADAGAAAVQPEPVLVVDPEETRHALEVEPETTATPRQSAVSQPAQESVDAVQIADLTGRLIIRDVDGQDLAGENGEFFLRPIGETLVEARRVKFEDGRFELDAVPAGIVQIERAATALEDGPRPVVFENAQFGHTPGEALLLLGSYLPDSTLRVVDALTGAELESVSVLRRGGRADQLHPGPYSSSALSVRNQPSPVRIPRKRWIHSYWVTAPNYTWSHLKVDHERGGERTVALHPAGSLAIQASGHDETLALFLRVVDRATGRLVASCSLDFNDEGPTFQGFGGIPVGEYAVRAEIGELDDPPTVLDEALVTVSRGTTTEVFLEPISELVPEAVPVHGTIVLPPGHEDLRVSLRILPVDGKRLRRWDTRSVEYETMGRANGVEGVLTWYAQQLTPGRYLFLVRPIQYGLLVDVPRTPIDDVRIELPALHEVVVRATDAASADPVEGALLRWTRELPIDAGLDGWVNFGLDPESDSTTLLVPSGPIFVAGSGSSHGQEFLREEIRSGGTELTLELPPLISLEIVLQEGEANVPWVPELNCTIQSTAGGEPQPCGAYGDGRLIAFVPDYGVYEIAIDAPDGYLPVTPTIVRIYEGGPARVVIDLVR